LAVVSLALAGCAKSDIPGNPPQHEALLGAPATYLRTIVHGPDGVLLPGSAYPGKLPAMAQHYVGTRSAGEPTIGINAKGIAIYPSTAFDVAMGHLASTRVMVSQDNGTTWYDRTPSLGNLGGIESDPTSLDPYVYADPVTGRLFSLDLYAGCSELSWTDNAGLGWTTNPIACGIPADDHPTFAAGPFVGAVPPTPLYPNVLYYCINQVGATSCTRSLDGGLTWIAGQPPYPGAERRPDADQLTDSFCGGQSGHVLASWATGTVFLPKGQCGVAEVARSTDNGATWTPIVVDRTFGFSGHDGAVAVDHKGTVYYFFLDGKTLPRLSVSHDDGKTWGPAMNVTAPGVTTAKFPAITAGADGRIAFLYVGSTPAHGAHYADRTDCPEASDPSPLAPSCPYKYPREVENATWNGYIGFSLDADGPAPVFATTTANPLSDPLRRGDCVLRCHGMFDFLDLQANPANGQVWASLVDLCNEKCATSAGTFRDPITNRGAVGVQEGGDFLGRNLG
jgi:hypothetical protein